MTALPEGTHLAYTDWREAWYNDPREKPQVGVAASAEGAGGGVVWEFFIEEHDFGGAHGKAIRLGVFDDAFAAFAQIPEFFAALGAGDVTTLDEVIGLLCRIGAADETARTSPYGSSKDETGDKIARAVAARVPNKRLAQEITAAVRQVVGEEE